MKRTPDGICTVLRELRKLRGWTQGDLADKAGCSRTLICQIETGHTQITQDKLIDIAGALGYEVHVSFVKKGGRK